MGKEHVLAEGGRSLPVPSAELTLIRVFVKAHLRSCHLKAGERRAAFIQATESEFDLIEHDICIPRLRASAQRLAELRADEEALEWYRSKYAVLAG